MCDFSEVMWVPPTGLGEGNGTPQGRWQRGSVKYSAKEHLAEHQAHSVYGFFLSASSVLD